MSHYETLSLSIDKRGVASLGLNVPEKRNALTATMIGELTEFAEVEAHSGHMRAVILSGHGGFFCSGGDLEWMRIQINADRQVRMHEARKLALMLKVLNEIPIPLIGKIHGGAFGGGIGMISVCDVAIAHADAKFGLTETRLGLIPATIGPYVLARLGEGMARRVFMSGRIFDAKEALQLGLIADVCAHNEIDDRIEREVKPYLRAAPNAVAAAKAYVRDTGHAITDAVIEQSIQRLADIWESPEAARGIDAFLAGTSPDWVVDDER
ncbi:MAG: crotonase/enoyl-CoA hydratase family protein [Rhodobacteraceae bacterium]|nr:crotonase/enoyl-CoA hydratase family protein [Paracoccaceae bacterium]